LIPVAVSIDATGGIDRDVESALSSPPIGSMVTPSGLDASDRRDASIQHVGIVEHTGRMHRAMCSSHERRLVGSIVKGGRHSVAAEASRR